MENWKRILVIGSAAAGVVMVLQKRTTAGLVLGGVGLAVLAAEYPEKFQEIKEQIPEYVERGTRYLDVVSRVGERLADAAESRGAAWYDSLIGA